MKFLRTACSSVAVFGLALAVGCGAAGSSASNTAADGTEQADGTDAQDAADSAGNEGTDASDSAAVTDGADGADGTPVECAAPSAKARGFVQTSRGIVYYHNEPVVVHAGRDAAKGCVNELELELSIAGGCILNLQFQTFTNSWGLAKATFKGDTKCGDFWPADDLDTVFTADVAGARTSLTGMNVPASADGCTPHREVRMLGEFSLSAPSKTNTEDRVMEIGLNELTITGVFDVANSTASGCPVDARTCQGVACGPDYFGVECGACGEGLTCSTGVCVEGGCKPDSTNKLEGGAIADQSYMDDTNTAWTLHSNCAEPAVWMIKVAHWCSACAYLAPTFQELYNRYSPLGVKFVLLVGQDNAGKPATVAQAASYRTKHGYQDGWIVVADPDWALTEQVITSTSDYIPSHSILDRDMILRQASANSDSVYAEEVALLLILRRAGLVD